MIPSTDGKQWISVADIPVPVLREHYEALYQFLIAAIRARGGVFEISKNYFEDDPPKRFRLYMDESANDYILSAVEEQ